LKYCGIDASITSTGIVILDNNKVMLESNVAFPSKHNNMHLHDMYMFFRTLFSEFDSVALEGYSFHSEGRGVSKQIELGTMIRYAAIHWQKPLYIIAPQNLKKFAGVSKKDEMKLGVYKTWGYENKSGDIVDAYALAQYCRALTDKRIKINTVQKQAIEAWQKNKIGMWVPQTKQ